MLPKTFTEQSLVEYVVPLLLKQKLRSRNKQGTCQYNGIHGRHCAIGFLIPPEEYDPEWDRHDCPIGEIYNNISTIRHLDPNFLEDLQTLHDTNIYGFNTSLFKSSLVFFCSIWNINTSFLNKLEFKECAHQKLLLNNP